MRLSAAAREGERGGPVASRCRRRYMAASVARGAAGVAAVTGRVAAGTMPVAPPADNPHAGAWPRRGGGMRRERRLGDICRAPPATVPAPNGRLRGRCGFANADGSLRPNRARQLQGGRRSFSELPDRAGSCVAMRSPRPCAAPVRRDATVDSSVLTSFDIRRQRSGRRFRRRAEVRPPPPAHATAQRRVPGQRVCAGAAFRRSRAARESGSVFMAVTRAHAAARAKSALGSNSKRRVAVRPVENIVLLLPRLGRAWGCPRISERRATVPPRMPAHLPGSRNGARASSR